MPLLTLPSASPAVLHPDEKPLDAILDIVRLSNRMNQDLKIVNKSGEAQRASFGSAVFSDSANVPSKKSVRVSDDEGVENDKQTHTETV